MFADLENNVLKTKPFPIWTTFSASWLNNLDEDINKADRLCYIGTVDGFHALSKSKAQALPLKRPFDNTVWQLDRVSHRYNSD